MRLEKEVEGRMWMALGVMENNSDYMLSEMGVTEESCIGFTQICVQKHNKEDLFKEGWAIAMTARNDEVLIVVAEGRCMRDI